MLIYLCPSAFAPARGGVEELTLKLAQRLIGAGHDVLVVVNQHPPQLPRHDAVEGVAVLRLPFPPPGRRPQSVVRFLRSVRGAREALDALGRRPTLVHVICPSSQTAPLTRWAHRRDVPVVITSQGETEMDAHRLYQRSRWMRIVLRHQASRASALSACSAWTARKAALIAPPFARAEVILNGVEPDDWPSSPLPDAPIVCAWGRQVPQKGLDLLIDAFPLVQAEIPQARLILGGDGTEHDDLTRRAGPGVEFLGSLDRDGVRNLLEQSRVAVVPSRVEPFGIVAVEALASGRALVYSTSGGLAEAAGDLGIGVDPTDRRALAEAVVTALRVGTDQDAARARARTLSWESLTARYLDLYATALSRQAGRS